MTVHDVVVIGKLGRNRVHEVPSLLEYLSRYSVIFDPPVLTGAVHVTASWALPLTATTDVGLPGTVGLVTRRKPVDLSSLEPFKTF